MSAAAKVFLATSVVLAGGTIYGVHAIQHRERETMYAGVLRDEARTSAKRAQKLRELEFEDQLRKRAYLEQLQSVSSSSSKNATMEAQEIKVGNPITKDSEVDWGCQTCERP